MGSGGSSLSTPTRTTTVTAISVSGSHSAFPCSTGDDDTMASTLPLPVADNFAPLLKAFGRHLTAMEGRLNERIDKRFAELLEQVTASKRAVVGSKHPNTATTTRISVVRAGKRRAVDPESPVAAPAAFPDSPLSPLPPLPVSRALSAETDDWAIDQLLNRSWSPSVADTAATAGPSGASNPFKSSTQAGVSRGKQQAAAVAAVGVLSDRQASSPHSYDYELISSGDEDEDVHIETSPTGRNGWAHDRPSTSGPLEEEDQLGDEDHYDDQELDRKKRIVDSASPFELGLLSGDDNVSDDDFALIGHQPATRSLTCVESAPSRPQRGAALAAKDALAISIKEHFRALLSPDRAMTFSNQQNSQKRKRSGVYGTGYSPEQTRMRDLSEALPDEWKTLAMSDGVRRGNGIWPRMDKEAGTWKMQKVSFRVQTMLTPFSKRSRAIW